jgi:hypothetical protein
MIDIKSNIRKAIIDELAGLTYTSVPIPVNQDFLTSPAANINLGNVGGFQAYVIFQNQTVNPNNTKQCLNENSSFQLDIVTVFNANSGGSIHAENIATSILTILNPNNTPNFDITISGMNTWRMRLVSTRSIAQETNTSRVFRNILVFELSVNQYQVT